MASHLRFRLRDETRARHDRLDGRIAPLFKDLAGYKTYLLGAWRARSALEALIFSEASPVGPWLIPASAGRMAADLLDLDLAPEACAPGWTGPTPDAAGLWGVGYVLAGSALGATHLRAWARRLSLTESFAAQHLAHQADCAALWPAFVDALDAAQLTPAEAARCVAGADLAFAAFEACLAAPVDA
ncbi:biliverdin-producing heme oxygenase [Phenylobacterium aquaticum]|uniref:biliverdin-producing heme oxygenase n=1 Tax=Phenylobacterium aquaticum TaxID=1763816 RepID=UPI001F5CCEDA|nr:biliverdin-producing heme oxygenase [Phenylobacterium aquaticum]MCI3135021.1 biliverdin-producing heme oxygenase [Phenylobacterium aquaticum]